MILDSQALFSDAQALTVTALATNVIDLGADRSIGSGEPMAIAFQVDVAADQGTGDETYQVDVEYASNAAITTARQLIGRRIFQAGTPTAPAQDADLLVAGFMFYIPIPPALLSESERFLAVRYTLGGTTPTLTLTAALVPMSFLQVNNILPDGLTITG